MDFVPTATHPAFPLGARIPPQTAAVTRTPEAGEAAVVRTTLSQISTRPKRILVIDDESVIRQMLTRALRRAAYDVETVEDGEAGWTALCTERFDLLITDHAMPRLKGLDLVRRLRANSSRLPVILISGCIPYADADVSALLCPGMALEKPFSLAEVLVNVGSLMIATTTGGAEEARGGRTPEESVGNQQQPAIPRAAG